MWDRTYNWARRSRAAALAPVFDRRLLMSERVGVRSASMPPDTQLTHPGNTVA